MKRDLTGKSLRAVRALATRRVAMDCDRMPFVFENVPSRKIPNWILAEASILVKPERPWGSPTHAQIEPTNACNLRCVPCPVTEGLEQPTRQMDMYTYRKIIDQPGQHLFIILPWDWGEPFLNPSVCDMIAYPKAREIGVISSANGHAFATGDHAERLVRSGIDYIIIAVDGLTQSTYERYPQGGELEMVIRGITSIVKTRDALGSRTPLLDLRFIVMKHNDHEIPQLQEFSRSLGVDALILRTLCTHDDGEYCVTDVDGSAFIPDNRAYHPFRLDPMTQSRIRHKVNPCKVLWNNPAIHSDGKIFARTFDPHGRGALGDLEESSFADIWRGSAYRDLRRRFRTDYQGLALYRYCTYVFEGGSMGEEKDREAVFFETRPGTSSGSPAAA